MNKRLKKKKKFYTSYKLKRLDADKDDIVIMHYDIDKISLKDVAICFDEIKRKFKNVVAIPNPININNMSINQLRFIRNSIDKVLS